MVATVGGPITCQWRSLVAFLIGFPAVLSAVSAPTFNHQVLFDQYAINVQIDDGRPPSLAYGRLKLAVDDGRGGLRLIDDITAVSVADPTGQPMPWDEAQFVLARALKRIGPSYRVLPGGTSTLLALETDSGHRFFLPQAFDKTTRLEALGTAQMRSVRAQLFKQAILRALALEEAQHFDHTLASSLAAMKTNSVVLLGLADAGMAWGEYSYEQLRIIASSAKASQHAGPSISAQATARQAAAAKVSKRISKSRLAKAGHALSVLAYGVELAVEFDESLTRQRFLAEMGQDVMLLQTLDDARRLLEAGDTDPALLDGLEAAQAELTTLSKSRLHQYAAAGAEAFTRSLPTLGLAIATYMGTGGAALVAREITALAGELDAFAKGVLSLSALTTLGHALHQGIDGLVAGDGVGPELEGMPVRELMGLHQRIGAEASALMYNMLWKDRWGNVTSLAGLGKGIGLTIAEWKASLKGWSIEEEYRSEVSKRVAAVHQTAALGAAMPALLEELRRVYLAPAGERGGAGDGAAQPVTVESDGWRIRWDDSRGVAQYIESPDIQVVLYEQPVREECEDDEVEGRVVSVVGELVSIEIYNHGYCGGAHPFHVVRFSTIDLRTGAKVDIRQLVPDAVIVAALKQDALVRKTLGDHDPQDLASLIRQTDGGCAMTDLFLATSFAFYDVRDGKVVVRFGLSHGCEVLRGAFTEIEVELPVPQGLDVGKADAMGLLMKDLAPGPPRRVKE